jgi:hypothetical protein
MRNLGNKCNHTNGGNIGKHSNHRPY